jgi:hypothetical protein
MLGGISVASSSIVVNVAKTSLTFLTPEHIAGQVNLVLTASGGTSTGAYTYVAPPTITLVSPHDYGGATDRTATGGQQQPFLSNTHTHTHGPVLGGTEVTILGTNFYANITIMLGTISVTPSLITPTSLTFTTPPATGAGQVTLTLTTPFGATSTLFTYVDAATWTELLAAPKIFSVMSGRSTSAAIITGANFVKGFTAVSLNRVDGSVGHPVAINVVSASKIKVLRPTTGGAISSVTVTVDGNINTASMSHTFANSSYISRPAVVITSQNGNVNVNVNSQAGKIAFVTVGTSVKPSFSTTGGKVIMYKSDLPVGSVIPVKVNLESLKSGNTLIAYQNITI